MLSCDIENQDVLECRDGSRDEDGSGQMCPICLEEYVAGDNVSWSRHQNCRHAFHKTCIEGWLKQLDREGFCPFCRGPYLNKLDENENEIPDSQVDLESQLNNTDNDPAADPATVDEERDQCNECSDSFVKMIQPVGSEETAELPIKSKSVYSSFCIVHGLLR